MKTVKDQFDEILRSRIGTTHSWQMSAWVLCPDEATGRYYWHNSRVGRVYVTPYWDEGDAFSWQWSASNDDGDDAVMTGTCRIANISWDAFLQASMALISVITEARGQHFHRLVRIWNAARRS